MAFADPPRTKSPAVRGPAAAPRARPETAAPEPVEPASAAEEAPSLSKFPDLKSGKPDEIWQDYFAKNQPAPADVRREILKLHNQSQHEHVIAALEAALVNGQSQPWMYEVLASTMTIQKYPKEDVERVVLSMTDFGSVDFDTMMFSAAYLVRFDRVETALRLFRQASRLSPDRSEPYVLALEHAEKLKSIDDIVWSACGILENDWSKDHVAHQQLANDAIANVERTLAREKDEDQLAKVRERAAEARRRDLVVELAWSGNGDLDLEVEEPFGSVCSISQPQTPTGGFLLNDGYGPKPEDCKETYVCPMGPSGDYRVRVKLAWGKIVSDRATLTITTHKGTPDEKTERRTIVLEKGQGSTVVELKQGRRTQPRVVFGFQDRLFQAAAARPVRRPRRDDALTPAALQFLNANGGGRFGAVGLQPVIQNFFEGSQMTASAIVSPDRRYVRMAISPVFSNITDVFTFSFFGGQQGNVQPGQNP